MQLIYMYMVSHKLLLKFSLPKQFCKPCYLNHTFLKKSKLSSIYLIRTHQTQPTQLTESNPTTQTSCNKILHDQTLT